MPHPSSHGICLNIEFRRQYPDKRETSSCQLSSRGRTLVSYSSESGSTPLAGSVVNLRMGEVKEGVKKETDVHTRHCCKECGCEYGEDSSVETLDGKTFVGCTVVSGSLKQEFSCGEASVCCHD